jgi:cobalamin biosynthesis Mg chelatase CobN
MIGKRHRLAPPWGRRPAFGSMLVFALLALACFPILAQADSSEAQYEDALDTVTGGKIPTRSGPPANASKQPSATNDSTNSGSSGNKSSASNRSSKGGRNAASNGEASKGQGSPGERSNSHRAPAAKPIGLAPTEEEGNTSPLVPILIAIAVLAAISIGVVVMRQRRLRDGADASPASPEAS